MRYLIFTTNQPQFRTMWDIESHIKKETHYGGTLDSWHDSNDLLEALTVAKHRAKYQHCKALVYDNQKDLIIEKY